MVVHMIEIGTPCRALIFEIADQFLLFRIDTDYRKTRRNEFIDVIMNIAELKITIRMPGCRYEFLVTLQRIAFF